MTNAFHDDTAPVTEAELHAYVDGVLTPSRRAAVAAYLAARPAEAARARAYWDQNIALHRGFPLDREPALRTEHVEAARRLDRALAGPTRRHRGMRVAASAAAAVILGAVGWLGAERYLGADEPALVSFAREAAQAHVTFVDTPGTREAGASAEPVAPGGDVVSWLTEQVSAAPRHAPDLSSVGLELMNSRVLPTASGPAVQLLYGEPSGAAKVSLYVGHANDPRGTSFTYVEDKGVSLFYWQQGRLAYALSGELGRDALRSLSMAVDEAMRTQAANGEAAGAAPAAEGSKAEPAPDAGSDGVITPDEVGDEPAESQSDDTA